MVLGFRWILSSDVQYTPSGRQKINSQFLDKSLFIFKLQRVVLIKTEACKQEVVVAIALLGINYPPVVRLKFECP